MEEFNGDIRCMREFLVINIATRVDSVWLFCLLEILIQS